MWKHRVYLYVAKLSLVLHARVRYLENIIAKILT